MTMAEQPPSMDVEQPEMSDNERRMRQNEELRKNEELRNVTKKIDQIEQQIAHLNDDSPLTEYNQKKEEQIREKEKLLKEDKKQLREKEKQLREDKKQLRDEKKLLMERDDRLPTGEGPVRKKPRVEPSFWANIRSATENDDVKSDELDDESNPEPKLSSRSLLVFSDTLPHDKTINQLYIRQAYIDIYDIYIEKYTYILVSGTPGVGKTIFSLYVLYRLLMEPGAATVLYASAKGATGEPPSKKQKQGSTTVPPGALEAFRSVLLHGYNN